MKRPQDEVTLSLEEGEALIERLEHNTLSAADRHLLVQVVRWRFWLLFVVQEAKLRLKRLRTLVFGKAPPPPQEEVFEGGAGMRCRASHGASGGQRRDATPGGAAPTSP
jgi:hypothetical protein